MAQEAGVFPKSLKSYVQRALALCKDEKQSAACQEIMKEGGYGKGFSVVGFSFKVIEINWCLARVLKMVATGLLRN
ncbi:hypothetical protein ES288_D06G066400v1 [Gossypium darwinii]|uniref:Uncharacterized protein n=1 Tax=Gossypium darwinii TaxID=34276 RepID=A0A5D2C701_GOSDA|nr:hypothetical protein ES288_D06G066400v1 [Gossypium darwinii]